MLMTKRRRKGLRGQSLVEVAISLPVLLLLALGVTDIGRAFYYREAVTNSARQALRIAVSPPQHATADAVCAGAGGPSAVTVTSLDTTRRQLDRLDRQHRVARKLEQWNRRGLGDQRRHHHRHLPLPGGQGHHQCDEQWGGPA